MIQKRIISLSLASAMAIGTASGVYAQTENNMDIKTSSHYIEGVGDGRFSANEYITREAIATMISRASNLEGGHLSFLDSDSIASWALEAVGELQGAGIANGDNKNNFRPKDKISRAELAALIVRTYEKTKGESIESGNISFDDVSEDDWYSKEVNKAAAVGLIKGTGNGNFNPLGNASRADAVVMINRMIGFEEDMLDDSFAENLHTDFKDTSEWPNWAKTAIMLASSDFQYTMDKGKLVLITDSSEYTINTSGVHSGNLVITTNEELDITYGPEQEIRTIEGDLTLDGDISGEATLRNILVKGDLIVNTPRATITADESFKVTGTTYIQDISGNTFNNRGKLNKVKISDSNGGSFNNAGTISSDITISPSSKSTAPIVLKGTIDSPITVSGDNKPQVSLAPNANIKGEVTIDAKDTQMDIDKAAKLEQTMVINKPMNLISPKPVKAKIAEGVEIFIKTSKESEGQRITSSDISGDKIEIPKLEEDISDNSNSSTSSTGGGSTGSSPTEDESTDSDSTNSTESQTKKGIYGVSPFNAVKYVEFKLESGESYVSEVKINGAIVDESKYHVNTDRTVRVIVGSKTDEVTVTIDDLEYTIIFDSTKIGEFREGALNVDYVEFQLGDGKTISNATVNGASTDKFANDNGIGRVVVTSKSDEVKVTINGNEYTIVK